MSWGCFSSARIRLLKLYSISFFIRRYSCFFSSSIISPSLSCCYIDACVLNYSSIFASLTIKSSTAGDNYCMRVLLSLSFCGLLISLNLTRKSWSRLRNIAMRSITFSRILRVRWASTIVGFPKVCFKLLMI